MAQEITLSQALDLAVAKLPLFRRLTANVRLRNQTYRQRVLNELREDLHDDPECCSMFSMRSTFADERFTVDTPFAIDPAKIEALIAIILKYLPIILAFFKTNPIPLVVLILSLALSQSGAAQDMICENGQCVLRSAARVATAPVRVISNYAAVSNVQSYGSAGIAATSYGSAGASGVSRWTPIRNLFGGFRQRAAARSAGYGSAGNAAATGYGSSGEMMVMPEVIEVAESAPQLPQVIRTASVNCACSQMGVCACEACECPQLPEVTAIVRPVSTAPLIKQFRTPVRSSIAMASATARAAAGIKGHHSIDLSCGKRVGVGWSSSNPRPRTCYNGMPGDYAVVRGRDGWYATLVLY